NMTIPMALRGGGSVGATIDNPLDVLGQLEPGTHSGYIRLGVRVARGVPGFGSSRLFTPPPPTTHPAAIQSWVVAQRLNSSTAALAPDALLGEVEVRLPLKFELVNADEAVVRKIDDEKFRPGVVQSLNVDRLRLMGNRFDAQISCS